MFRIEDQGEPACDPTGPVYSPLTCLADLTLPPLCAPSAPAAILATAEITIPEMSLLTQGSYEVFNLKHGLAAPHHFNCNPLF